MQSIERNITERHTMFRVVILTLIILLNWSSFCFAQDKKETSQEVKGFSLIQYNKVGDKSWELNGDSAKVEEERVGIDNISAVAFSDKSAFKLKARKGELDRKDNIVHLEDSVVIKSTDGTFLSTDSLDWNPKTKNVSSEAPVYIKRAGFDVGGKGAVYNFEESILRLKREVTADIECDLAGDFQDRAKKTRTVISCDGPLEINYNKNKATFQNNVKVKDPQGDIFADRIDVYFRPDTRRIKCVVARGGVKIVNGENITYSEKAIYLVDEGRLVLPKKPKLVIQTDTDSRESNIEAYNE